MRHVLAVALMLLTAGAARADYPSNLVADGLPVIPEELKQATKPYLGFSSASFLGWEVATRGQYIATRHGNVPRLRNAADSRPVRRHSTIGNQSVQSTALSPVGNGELVYAQDREGDEFYQLYHIGPGSEDEPVHLTNGAGRNTNVVWAKDGSFIVYSSTRRNGRDTDIYRMDPRNPATDTLVTEVSGGGWQPQDVSPDGKHALVLEYVSVNESYLHLLDLATGQMRRISPDPRRNDTVSYGIARYGPNGTIYVTTDHGNDFQFLASLNPRTRRLTRVSTDKKWDVETFAIAPDGSFIAYVVNVAGVSVLKRIDPKTGAFLKLPKVPHGVITGLEIAPWGEIGFSLTSARVPGDAFSIDLATMTLRRWTDSGAGPLDTLSFVNPEYVATKSFDGLEVSGFLYLPDPVKFPGPRPLIINIHGGPESQSRPIFLGADNYLLNEMGIAQFYPNVRGSNGYGKKFLLLDNGAKREDAVKDIGAFIEVLRKRPALDPNRFGVTGSSYGGYMALASLIRFPDRLKAGVEVMGISHFVTFLTDTQNYRRDLRRAEYGDERNPKMREHLEKISPLTNADKIKVPLMVVTGANDPRVPASEADQIVAAVRKNGGEAWHLLAKDEGHGFKKKTNQDIQFWATLLFWKTHLLN